MQLAWREKKAQEAIDGLIIISLAEGEILCTDWYNMSRTS